jgi:hypothetical protein
MARNSEISGPFQKAAPQPFVKDLAKFLRARNYGIFGPRKFCQTRISNVAPQCFVKDLAKFRRAGNSGISGLRKFFPGRNFRP